MKGRLVETLLLVLSVSYLSTAQEDDICHYNYVRQPSSETECNPWPLLGAGSMLPLHCYIRAPQSNHLPNVIWYREHQKKTMQVYPGDLKYTNPVMSGDIESFNFVNFSLIIHNVTSSDVGCYHCEIRVTAGNDCEFDIRPSNQYCLLKYEEYGEATNCVSVPVDEDVVCAANKTCGVIFSPVSLFGNEEAPPLENKSAIINESVPPQVEESIHSVSLGTQQTVIGLDQTTSTTTSSAPVPSPTLLNHRPLCSLSHESQSTPSLDHSSLISSQSSSQASKATPLQSTHPPRSQQELRIGLYVGVGVCCLLLVVILILLAAVAVLCKAPGVKKQKRNSVAATRANTEPLNTTVWTRPSPTVTTSLINEGSLHLHTEALTQSSGVNERMWTDITPGQSRSLPGAPPSHRTEGLQTGRGAQVHHRLSLTNQVEGRSAQEHPGSPDAHYYHVLEQPRYYNFNWLASSTEGRELLLQNWREGDTHNTSKYCTERHAEVKGHVAQPPVKEEGTDHRKVVPLLGGEGTAQQQNRQVYTRLDCSKLDPRGEYATVSVGSNGKTESIEQTEN